MVDGLVKVVLAWPPLEKKETAELRTNGDQKVRKPSIPIVQPSSLKSGTWDLLYHQSLPTKISQEA